MLYNFMELPNQTIISHSEILNRNDKEQVKVYIEKPIYGGFATATCYLPDYEWVDVFNFTENEMDYLKELVESEAHMIFEFARTGGFDFVYWNCYVILKKKRMYLLWLGLYPKAKIINVAWKATNTMIFYIKI